jgi:DNA invertase Pin-like site-specific DNA recombinase
MVDKEVPVNAAIYLRVSTTSQAEEGLSLDAQLSQCEAYLKMKGWGPACLFVDAGISAATVKKRPAMTELIEAVKTKQIQRVVTSKLDRAFRNVRDAAETLEVFRAAEASIAFLDLSVDTSTSSGEMMMNLMAAFAQFERKRIGERVQAVNLHLAEGGRWLGSKTPHGYSYNRDTKALEVDEAEAETVRYIFDRYTNGAMGANAIAKRLNQEGRRKRDESYWTSNGVLRILRNPVYQGDVLYGRGITRDPRWHAKEEDDPKWVRSLGTHPPLISRDEFERAAQKLRRNTGPGRSPSGRHLYAGRLYCALCGETCYVKSTSRNRWCYLCKRVASGMRPDCPRSKSILTNKAEYLITQAVLANLTQAKAGGWKIKANARPAPSHDKMKGLLEARLERFREMRLEGEISKERFDRERDTIRLQLSDLDQPAAPLLLSDSVRGMDFEGYLKDAAISVEEKRERLSRWVNYILLDTENLTVHFAPLDYRGWEAVKTVSLSLKRGGWRE